MSAQHLNQYRDNAINKILQGKQMYNSGGTYEEKLQGYNFIKQGIGELIAYAKSETNDQLKKLTREKIIQFTTELESFKNYLSQFSNQVQPLQNISFLDQAVPNSQFNQLPNQNKNNEEEKKQDGQPQQPKVNKQTEEDDKLKNNLESAIVLEKPNVKWDDVAGLENAKKSLQETIIIPMRFPELFLGARKPWMGILLYGPPGTGKTFLAKACATECDGTFFSVSSSDLISKFVGESERLIKTLFQMARDRKPSIIFIDEVDSMAGNRDGNDTEASRRVKTEFLVQMQGVGTNNEKVLVLGATNLPWALDPAIRRRFEKRIYIPLPDSSGRLALIQNRMEQTPNTMDNQQMIELSQMLEGFSGADIGTLIRDASFEPLRKCERATHFKQIQNEKNELKWTPCSPSDPQGKPMKMMSLSGGQLWLPPVEMDDFLQVLPKCKPTVGQGDLKKYEEWTQQFGQEG